LLRSGAAQIVVGTHALAEEATAFHKLGLVIIDEQHRFGVMTRARLMSKGHRPDVLVMTATPIPRTLALTLYGDLDASVLDELPPGRTPIATKVYRDAAREKAYDVVRRELKAGRQNVRGAPAGRGEREARGPQGRYQGARPPGDGRLSGVPIGLVHGRQSAVERNEEMERFRRGETKILVATTVIEVGVDVPNATVMLIEHAERFGLSQLHQLRGRVGRGGEVALPAADGNVGGGVGSCRAQASAGHGGDHRRLRIAEADLEVRGPGEFWGRSRAGCRTSRRRAGRIQTILKRRARKRSRWSRKIRSCAARRMPPCASNSCTAGAGDSRSAGRGGFSAFEGGGPFFFFFPPQRS